MANKEQLAILKEGVEVWNKWREDNPDIKIKLKNVDLSGMDLSNVNFIGAHLIRVDLSRTDLREASLFKAILQDVDICGADLRKAILDEAYLSEVNLRGANLNGAFLVRADCCGADMSGAYLRGAELNITDLVQANLSGADLSGAYIGWAYLREADLTGASLKDADLRGTELTQARLVSVDLAGADLTKADLTEADLTGANFCAANLSESNLMKADLTEANLSDANLSGASLVLTNLTRSILTSCNIYGISAWDLELEGAEQTNLVITRSGQPTVTVSNMKVAQFLYLLINNPEIRDVLDTITSKVVLILGRFTNERIKILKKLRAELQARDYIPVLFDFNAPKSRDVEETVSTLAHMARFIVADITDPKAIPQELSMIVRNLQSVPVLPLLHNSAEPWGMFTSIKRRSTVLPILKYSSESELIGKIQSDVIEVAEKKVIELSP